MADGLSILHYGFLVLALARAAGAHSGLGSSKEFSANVLRNFYFVITDVPLLRRLGRMIEQLA